MTKPTSDRANPIDRLLQDRAQFVNWLAKLNSSAEGSSGVPESVRSRVRADYERRLDAVLQELRTHVTAIEEQVGDLSARHGELTAREQEEMDQLAEAEVRHLVGEYDATRWDGIRAERMKVIVQVREEIGQTAAEIDRLNEVLATIRAPVEPEPVPEPEAPPVTSSAPRPAVTAPAPEPPPAEPEPERPAASAPPADAPIRQPTPKPQPAVKPPTAQPAKKEEPGRTLWFPSGKPEPAAAPPKTDELAFIKSIEPTQTPAPKGRGSGGFIKPDQVLTSQAPEPRPSSGSAMPEAKDRASGSAGQKTLKCGECGTLNRPTEWYCERCGAELAAL
jgi:hypothetical protein